MIHELKVQIELDENKVPQKLSWQQGDNQSEVKALFLQAWDKKEGVTTSLHLWTKTLTTEEMKHFFHQSLVALVESFEKAMPNDENNPDNENRNTIIRDLYATCNYLAEKMQLIPPEQIEALLQRAKAEENLGQEEVDLKKLL